MLEPAFASDSGTGNFRAGPAYLAGRESLPFDVHHGHVVFAARHVCHFNQCSRHAVRFADALVHDVSDGCRIDEIAEPVTAQQKAESGSNGISSISTNSASEGS